MNMEILKSFTDEQLNNIAKLSAEDVRDMFIGELERRENERTKLDKYEINIGDCWLSIDNNVIRIKYIDKFEDNEYVLKCFDTYSENKNADVYIDYNDKIYLQKHLMFHQYTKVDPSIIDKLDELTDIYNRRVEELNNDYYEEFVNILNLED